MAVSEPTVPDFESSPDAYPVKLENFEGPLDLLIHLIKQNEVNIYDIPIALITAQYLEYLDLMQELDLDVAGEFLVMAATLIHIKSRTLLPRPDPARKTPRRTRASCSCAGCSSTRSSRPRRSCCTSARPLREAQWLRPDGRVAAIAGDEYEPELEVDLFSLLAAFRAVLERAKQRPQVALPPEQVSIEARIDAAAGAALGDRGVRLRGPVRRRVVAAGSDRDVPGAARDDSPEGRARLPGRAVRPDPRLQARAAGRLAPSRSAMQGVEREDSDRAR